MSGPCDGSHGQGAAAALGGTCLSETWCGLQLDSRISTSSRIWSSLGSTTRWPPLPVSGEPVRLRLACEPRRSRLCTSVENETLRLRLVRADSLSLIGRPSPPRSAKLLGRCGWDCPRPCSSLRGRRSSPSMAIDGIDGAVDPGSAGSASEAGSGGGSPLLPGSSIRRLEQPKAEIDGTMELAD